MKTEEKYGKLKSILEECGSAALAYSGGVDSTFLARVAVETLGDKMLLVTATSPTYTQDELEQAKRMAAEFGGRFIVIETDEFNDPVFLTNPPDRCYLCKSELFTKLNAIRREQGLKFLLDGSNADDVSDYRPGGRAAKECSVRSPLREAGLTKSEIRELSKSLGLETWNQPARACLASRFPYGEQFTPEAMRMVAEAEAELYSLGLSLVRVRSHAGIARIETTPEEIHILTDDKNRERIAAKLRSLGFSYVTVDLQGYRTGSMNETLTDEQKKNALNKQA